VPKTHQFTELFTIAIKLNCVQKHVVSYKTDKQSLFFLTDINNEVPP